MFHDSSCAGLARATEWLEAGFAELPAFTSAVDEAAMERVLAATTRRLGDNYPYFHPLYAGQMLKPAHPVAQAAYSLAMRINPNNHARDGGRASSEMEIEAVRSLAGIFGWCEFLGHLTSSGTLANLEALWISGQLAPGKRIVGSAQAHYTHPRISSVLRIEYASVATDRSGRMSVDALEAELRKGDVGTVVATLGTTAVGAVDPLDEILALRQRYGFRIHLDAAYGGYFRLIADALDEPARRAYAAASQADSIVIDPHKHGLQPYGCGCVLFRDPAVGRFYKHDSPYTYFTSNQLHLGEISLECSRSGAAAVALWATQQLLPLEPGGEFAKGLMQGRRAALALHKLLREDASHLCQPLPAPELDIVVWKLAAASAGQASKLAHESFVACALHDLHLALVQLPLLWFTPAEDNLDSSGSSLVTCLRSVLMKPEHEAWIEQIWKRWTAALADTTGVRGMMTVEAVTSVEKEKILIEIGDCTVTVLPQFGGKLSSILVKGHELLQAPLLPYGPRTQTMSFDEGDASGWDECLPSVGGCVVQTVNGPVAVPDHGDLWRVEWDVISTTDGSVTLRGTCFSLPLVLLRTVILTQTAKGYSLQATYTVTNTGASETPWAWSAHPGYASEAGDRVILPNSITSLRLEGSGGKRLGEGGAQVNWPIAKLVYGGETDLSMATSPESGTGDKLFAGPLTASENWCALERPKAGVRLRISFDPSATPYLGLWLCNGGWPDKDGKKQHCVALEPATAPVDSLGISGPWSRTLAAGASFSWPMTVDLELL